MKVYISGPMRGYEDYNRPAFEAASGRIVNAGLHPVNPFDLVDQDAGFSIREYMEKDVAALFECDAIAVLPGWQNSHGAIAEVALSCVIMIPALEGISLHDITWDIREWFRSLKGRF